MNKEILKLNQWLTEVLDSEEPPAYEVDRRTLQLLQQLRHHVQENDRRVRVIASQLCADASASAAEQRRLEATQRRLGLERVHLGAASQRVLAAVALSAQLLGLARPSTAGLLLEHSRLFREAAELTARMRQGATELRRQDGQLKQLLLTELTVQRQLSDAAVQRGADDAVMEQRFAKARFLAEKVHEYKNLVRKHEGILERRGFNEELTHDIVLRRHDCLQQKRISLQQLQQKLQQFRELPADPELARVKIAETETELEKLEATFNDKIHNMHSTL